MITSIISLKKDDDTDANNEVEQRPIDENDVCPICQEEFLVKKLPTTYCRSVYTIPYVDFDTTTYYLIFLDMVVVIMFMWNVWKYGLIIKFQPGKKQLNVHYVEKHLVHRNSSNKNFGTKRFFTFVIDYFLLEQVVLNKQKNPQFI